MCDVGSAMVEEEIKGQRRGRGVKRGFMTRNSVFPSPFSQTLFSLFALWWERKGERWGGQCPDPSGRVAPLPHPPHCSRGGKIGLLLAHQRRFLPLPILFPLFRKLKSSGLLFLGRGLSAKKNRERGKKGVF